MYTIDRNTSTTESLQKLIIPIYRSPKATNARSQSKNEEIAYLYISKHPKCTYGEIIEGTELNKRQVSKSLSWLKSRKSIRSDYLVRGLRNVYTIASKQTSKVKPRPLRDWLNHDKSRLMCEIPNCKRKAFDYDRGADKWMCEKHRQSK